MDTKQLQTYLTPDQVYQLNEKHGWFQYNDAQSDVSKAFAQDAIEMHERMRAAAPQMLAALRAAASALDYLGDAPDDKISVRVWDDSNAWNALCAARAAIAAAGAA